MHNITSRERVTYTAFKVRQAEESMLTTKKLPDTAELVLAIQRYIESALPRCRVTRPSVKIDLRTCKQLPDGSYEVMTIHPGGRFHIKPTRAGGMEAKPVR